MEAKINPRFLAVTTVIDWKQPSILDRAAHLCDYKKRDWFSARNCFHWVRDEIQHSMDANRSRVTCSASEVLAIGHGICYAKSHLLAALLRANGIAAGFSYQRLSDDDMGFCLHGFNGLYLKDLGWYRVDARGNKAGVRAEFDPPQEYLAFSNDLPGEVDYAMILPDPWPTVLHRLRDARDVQELANHLPDKLMMG